MLTSTTDLFLLDDLEKEERTSELHEGVLGALRAIADWMNTFVVQHHEDLGRAGPVCPFVPGALDRKTLWLAPVHIGDTDVPQVVEVVEAYTRRFLEAEPVDGDDAIYKVIVVVFTDLSADRAQNVFDAVLEQLAVRSYVGDGIVFGPFFKGNEGTAIYNPRFRPFQSPVPFLFIRNGVVDDWKFFLHKDEWMHHWAHRFGESAALALAEELRRSQWPAKLE